MTKNIILGFIVSFMLAAIPARAEKIDVDPKIDAARLLPVTTPWKGDFDQMKDRRLVRILVPQSRTFYFLDGAKERGISYEIAHDFEAWLNRKYKTQKIQIHVMLIPVTWEKLLSSVNAGLGDIALGGITITPQRRKTLDFTAPLATGVKEIIVTGPSSPAITKLDDLAGQKIYVRPSSSYAEHLKTLNKDFRSRHLKPVEVVDIDENLEDEDILEMLNAGLISLTVVDSYLGTLWAKALHKITAHQDIAVNEGGDLAWAIRKNSPLLMAEADEYISTHKQGSAFIGALVSRYLKSTKFIANASSKEEMKKFNSVVDIFRKYGKQYDFDYLMVLAQGYQESRLEQSARSHRGAVGIMQLLPTTAQDRSVNIANIDTNAESNIHAGVKYLRHLADYYVNDPAINDTNRLLLSFAAYNAGPGNLIKFRKHAEKSGLNPNVWFNNVEISASRIVGQETVQYVSNIYKYYIAYRLLLADEEKKKE